MEYEFSRDTVNGGFHAKFSLEHEAFSNWLVDEVGSDAEQVERLLGAVEKVRGGNFVEHAFQGKEYLLNIEGDDVTLRLNAACEGHGAANGDGLDPALSVNNDNFCAACGLDDFSMMLNAWKGFLNG